MSSQEVQTIPIDRITVINPRVRNKKTFAEIVENISRIGLKRPITVALRRSDEGPRYDLVCGQGRLEAYISLGQTEIPAVVIDAGDEDCLVMSLVENLARRQHTAFDLLQNVEDLRRRGYSDTQIASKTGLTVEYIRSVLHLLTHGEHRLLRAAESGVVPVSVAVDIAGAKDDDVQAVLQQAYEKKLLRGKKLLAVRRLIEKRRLYGKGQKAGGGATARVISVERLLRTYRDDIDKKRRLVRKAETTRDRLIFVTEGLRKLFADDHFVTLMRAENIDSLPRALADRLQTGDVA
jgi:ParB family chromosome partitioning protein